MFKLKKKNVLYLTKKQAHNISTIKLITTFYLTIQRFTPCAAGVAIAQNEPNENDA